MSSERNVSFLSICAAVITDNVKNFRIFYRTMLQSQAMRGLNLKLSSTRSRLYVLVIARSAPSIFSKIEDGAGKWILNEHRLEAIMLWLLRPFVVVIIGWFSAEMSDFRSLVLRMLYSTFERVE